MYLRNNILTIIVIFVLFLLGSLLIFISAETVITILMFIIAAFLITMAISFLLTSRQYVGHDKTKLILQSILLIALASSIFVFPKDIMRVIIGVLFIIIPLAQLLNSHHKWQQFLNDLPKYIIGIILILSFELIMQIMMYVLGAILIALGIYLLLLLLINAKNINNPNILFKIAIKYFIRKDKDKWEL